MEVTFPPNIGYTWATRSGLKLTRPLSNNSLVNGVSRTVSSVISKGSRVSTEVVACFPQEHTKGTKRMHVIRCLFISFDLLLIVEYMATRYGIYLLQGQ